MKKKKIVLISMLALGTLGYANVTLAEEATVATSNKEATQVSSEQKEVPTSSTSTVETSKEPTKEVEQVVSEVEKNVEKLVGEKKGEEVPVDETPAPSKIRQELLSTNYGISKEDLDKYTDEQLEQTMTLFTRYNYDVIGMDYGAYARLLNTLFVDKTVNANDALTQLSFNPSAFNSYSEMIPQVEQLQVYLKTLYPVNSTFIPGVNLTDEQLIAKLNKLQKFEEDLAAKGQKLPFGRIAGIIQDVVKDEETENTSTTESSSTAPSTTQSESKSKVVTNKKDGSLPKTGTKNEAALLGVLGIFTILGSSYCLYLKK